MDWFLVERKENRAFVWTASTPLPHMLQLDALRAFAVLAVLFSHFTLYTRMVRGVIQVVDLAGFGVRLFFVLSGFLITGILLRSKSHCEKSGSSIWYELRQFYVRRFLRIFPLFYFVLVLATVLGIPPVRETWLWHFSYLTNFYLFSHGWDGSINHFWSLAVEEQFYLVWPWVILLVNRRSLPATIVVMMVIGPLFRLLCALYTGNDRTPILPFSCFDTLGAGAYLALCKDERGIRPSRRYPFGNSGLCAGITLMAVFLLLCFSDRGSLAKYVIFDIAAALVAGWVVWSASFGFNGPVRKLLEARPLTYIGTISYAVYVYHNFVPYALHETINLPSTSAFLGRPLGWMCDFLLMCGATISLAAFSWRFFERPVNNLKRYFNYRGDRSVREPGRSGF